MSNLIFEIWIPGFFDPHKTLFLVELGGMPGKYLIKKPYCHLNDHAILCHDMSRTYRRRRRGRYAANIQHTECPKYNKSAR